MRIGIIDSGKGGLAVAKKIKKEEDQLCIILDQGFFPYGNKSKEFLLKRSFYLANILVEMGNELIILACNTLSIVALSFLRSCFNIPILGVFEYFIPYLTEEYTLIGSKATIAYAKEKYNALVYDGTRFIEAIEKNQDISFYTNDLKKIKSKALLLGCTHFLSLSDFVFPIPVIQQMENLKKDIEKYRTEEKEP